MFVQHVCPANLADMACTNISQMINVALAVTHILHAPQDETVRGSFQVAGLRSSGFAVKCVQMS